MLFSYLELLFKVADVPHPGQAWETAGDTLDAGKEKTRKSKTGWTVTVDMEYPTTKEVLEEKIPNNQHLSLPSTVNLPPSSVLKVDPGQIDIHSGACLLREEVEVHVHERKASVLLSL